MYMRTPTNQDGITLLVTLLLMGVLLGVSASLLNLTLKQFQLSSIAYDSERAFQAASAGIECALYHDFPKPSVGNSPFTVPGNGIEQPGPPASPPMISCMGSASIGSDDNSNLPWYTDPDTSNGLAISGGEQRFQFSWGNPAVCTEFSVYKFYSLTSSVDMWVNTINMNIDRDGDPATVEPCPQGSECTIIQSRGYNVACADIASGGRVVEREYTRIY